jgi:outer membrane protein assembly factor BamA
MSAGLAMARRVLLRLSVRARFLVLAFATCRAAPIAPLPVACDPTRVNRVVVTGAPAADVAPLAVLDGTHDDPARTERVAVVAAELLHATGYAHARVAVERAPGSCGVELRVAVARGPRFRIARIDFVGENGGVAATERLAALEDALGRVNAIGGAYVEDRMIRALDGLRRRYRDAGWIDASIDAPRASFDETHGEVAVMIGVHAGRRFRIGAVRARGTGSRVARAAVIEALGLRGGDWYDGAAVRRGIERARRELDRNIELHATVAGDRVDLDAVVEATQ